ncbi:MAG: Apo-citrate lyase phosphoribosyl-dephospho-CoA transferase [Proteobacteria bacterium]|nr:Apo-citrate lyase phosphoribosyl-dephospho-CoA transferase [Pseudomonadota bacterium]
MLERSSDALGPFAIIALAIDPREVKKACIALETAHPAARLIDLDVYSAAGVQIDRASLGVAARPCLVCQSPAVDCIRLKRHSLEEVIAQTHELLSPFNA